MQQTACDAGCGLLGTSRPEEHCEHFFKDKFGCGGRLLPELGFPYFCPQRRPQLQLSRNRSEASAQLHALYCFAGRDQRLHYGTERWGRSQATLGSDTTKTQEDTELWCPEKWQKGRHLTGKGPSSCNVAQQCSCIRLA